MPGHAGIPAESRFALRTFHLEPVAKLVALDLRSVANCDGFWQVSHDSDDQLRVTLAAGYPQQEWVRGLAWGWTLAEPVGGGNGGPQGNGHEPAGQASDRFQTDETSQADDSDRADCSDRADEVSEIECVGRTDIHGQILLDPESLPPGGCLLRYVPCVRSEQDVEVLERLADAAAEQLLIEACESQTLPRRLRNRAADALEAIADSNGCASVAEAWKTAQPLHADAGVLAGGPPESMGSWAQFKVNAEVAGRLEHRGVVRQVLAETQLVLTIKRADDKLVLHLEALAESPLNLPLLRLCVMRDSAQVEAGFVGLHATGDGRRLGSVNLRLISDDIESLIHEHRLRFEMHPQHLAGLGKGDVPALERSLAAAEHPTARDILETALERLPSDVDDGEDED